MAMKFQGSVTIDAPRERVFEFQQRLKVALDTEFRYGPRRDDQELHEGRQRRERDPEVVPAELHAVTYRFEGRRVLVVVVGEHRGARDELLEFGHRPRGDLLGEDGASGREDAVGFGRFERLVAVEDEVERGVAEGHALPFGFTPHERDAVGLEPRVREARVGPPLFGRDDAPAGAVRDPEKHLSAAGAEVHRGAGAGERLSCQGLVVPRERFAQVPHAEEGEIPPCGRVCLALGFPQLLEASSGHHDTILRSPGFAFSPPHPLPTIKV